MLAALSLIVGSLVIILTVCRRLTTSAAAVTAMHGSAFVKMESGRGRWNLPTPERRVWSSSQSLPSVPHTVIDMPAVSLAGYSGVGFGAYVSWITDVMQGHIV